MVRVGEDPQAVVEERPTAGLVLVVCGEALLDVGEPGSDTVMVSLQRRFAPMTPTPRRAADPTGYQFDTD